MKKLINSLKKMIIIIKKLSPTFNCRIEFTKVPNKFPRKKPAKRKKERERIFFFNFLNF